MEGKNYMTEHQEEVKRELEAQCLACTQEFQAQNFEERTFPYLRCKRCDVGRRLHEMEDPAWLADFVKRESW